MDFFLSFLVTWRWAKEYNSLFFWHLAFDLLTNSDDVGHFCQNKSDENKPNHEPVSLIHKE